MTSKTPELEPDHINAAAAVNTGDYNPPSGHTKLSSLPDSGAPEAQITSREEARARIFGRQNKRKTKVIDFFGAQIELRQPTFGESIELREESGGNEQNAALWFAIRFAYIPGTQERVFEDDDADEILKLPAGADIRRLVDALNEIGDVDSEEAAKN